MFKDFSFTEEQRLKIIKVLPNTFNWEYYLVANPDLVHAGIDTEDGAIMHYLQFGKQENRLYTRTSGSEITKNISYNQHSLNIDSDYVTNIVLFIQWYEPKDDETLKNITKCLENNLSNPSIHKICVFLESKNINLPEHLANHPKIDTYNIHERLTYALWMQYANKYYRPYIKILANTDIYFDKTLEYVKSQDFSEKTLYAITRKDLDLDNNIVQSHDSYGDSSSPTNPYYSHDCWIYQKLLFPMPDEHSINFELGIGNCDRLFKEYIEDECKINFINLYPRVNAIHLDRRTGRNRDSYPLKNNLIDHNKLNIRKFLITSMLKPYTNKLESICLLLTGKELQNNNFDTFMHRLEENLSDNIEHAKLLDFNISTQYAIPDRYLTILENAFRNVNIIHLDIPTQYDKYMLEEPCPTYGKLAGPNWCFFETIKQLSNYNTTLMLESDVFFSEDWLNNIYNYCRYAGSFWVSGSKNYSDNNVFQNHIYKNHLNGGVCLYATGNQQMQLWLEFCKSIFPLYIHHILPAMPYDYLLYLVIQDFLDFDLKNVKIWNFISKHYVCNNLIYNLSSEKDSSTTVEEFKRYYDFSILHKKDN
tara:strand:- start:17667 stop:19439 length:1773 start_codon:yes stop_codon:yes gene_type:complete